MFSKTLSLDITRPLDLAFICKYFEILLGPSRQCEQVFILTKLQYDMISYPL